MSYVLLIVDMQPEFSAANGKRVLNNCKRELRKAMIENASIIFLEYDGCGTTNTDLVDLVDGYNKVWFETKGDDDGSEEAEFVIRSHRCSKTVIKVCGVNTDCCVRYTVQGLTARFTRATIDVISDACASDYDHMYGLTSLRKMPNVNVTA